MFIKTVVIEGIDQEVRISRTQRGAEATIQQRTRHAGVQDICIAHIARDDDDARRFAQAVEVAKVVCGTDKRGNANATNSMIHDVLREMERVAGC
ncbi:MAG TPA: hypothetical protein PKE29_13560 [Phycisphaerales bacterium]|nr:hypothetical protein [Phycisphaerales bacterium]